MKKENVSSSILVISMGFLALHLIFDWPWAVGVSLAIGLIGVLSSYLSQKIVFIWMKMAQLLGYITPNILLSIIFFFILTPIAVLYRLRNKDILMLADNYDSYFLETNKVIDREFFERVW